MDTKIKEETLRSYISKDLRERFEATNPDPLTLTRWFDTFYDVMYDIDYSAGDEKVLEVLSLARYLDGGKTFEEEIDEEVLSLCEAYDKRIKNKEKNKEEYEWYLKHQDEFID